ncbi:MAG: SpoIID/LytB domain-containing protein, partial [Cyanobacteria bacterium]|nr:SpoIID/LytB domain-containing protein [Cyanobacteriota bacterium]
MNPAAGGIVSTSQIRSKFFTWRNSFARKWTAYSVLILALAGSFTSPALALERIQFIPPGESAGRGPQAESGSLRTGRDPQAESGSLRTAGRGPQAESGSLRTAGGSPAHAPSTDPSVLNEAGWQPALPAAPAMQISGQEQVQTRTARSMQLPTQIQAPPVVSQEMNSLRSRQDGGAPSPLQEKGIPSMPPTQSSAAANPSSTGSNGTIRVALNCSTSTADIVLPDGGQIYDEASQKLLAELPPQSYWQIKEVNGYSGKQLQLLGKTGSTANNRVLLASGLSNYEPAAYTRKFVSSVKSGFTRPPRIIDADGAKFALPVKTIAAQPVPAGEESKVRQVSTQNKSAINSSAKPVPPPPVVSGYVISTSRQNGVVSFNGKTYRGKLIIKPRNGEDPNFLVINQLDLEDYLLSVLPSEMPPYWGLDALKAQSIAARSYALANMNKHDKEGYDLKASTEDQVYLGVQTETEQSNRAVAETTGQVLKHNGKVVSAFFHSASGGATETSEHVYGGKVHYLKSVPD